MQAGGEWLRVVNGDANAYAEGNLYRLGLRRVRPDAPLLQAQQFNFAVHDDRVWPEKNRWYVRANLRRRLSFACRW